MTIKLYGIAEIAEEAGVDRHLVAQWYRRGKLPKPDGELRMGPVWVERRIRPWIDGVKQGQKEAAGR